MRTAGFLAFLLVAALTVSMAAGQDTPAARTSLKGFDGVAVVVMPVAKEAQAVGLSAEVLQKAASGRIAEAKIRVLSDREHRLAPRRPRLGVTVHTARLETGEQLYSIQVDLSQHVALLTDTEVTVGGAVPAPAVTWSADHVFGIVPGEQLAAQIQEALARMVDQFIEAYRKANPTETATRIRR